MDMAALMAAMGGMPGGSAVPPAPAAPAVPPEVRFASQLQTMRDMGFTDDAKSLRALTDCAGNVQFAIDRILDGRYD
jgi:ubiquilin